MIDFSYIQRKIAGRTAGVLKEDGAMDAAVIVPLVENEAGELALLFEVRAHHLKRQPSEICFPGGRIDLTDPSPEQAAIRELSEELGVQMEDIHPIAPLDVVVTPFRGLIHPFVAKLLNVERMQVNHGEVDHVFTVPLSFLYNQKPKIHHISVYFEPDHTFPLQEIANRASYNKRSARIPEYFYYYDDYVIWGITARILTNFIKLLKNEPSK